MIIAHRGLTSNQIKENTLASFLNAIRNGYDGIELDIRKTKDNKIIVLHDAFINRTSNGFGYIKNKTYKELKKINFGTKKFPAKIPLLKEVLDNINNSTIIIEMKEEFTTKELKQVLKYNKNNKILICSFFKRHLDNIKDLKYPKGLINYLLNSNINYNKYDFYLLYYKYYNERFLDKLEKIKKELYLYGLNNLKDIKNTKYYNSKLNYIVDK